jgi:hypothetical protein
MKPGIYPDMDEKTYRADPCDTPSLNQSTAKVILSESCRAAWAQHPRLGAQGRVATRVMDAGTVKHALTLGKPLPQLAILPFEDFRKKEAQAARDAAKADGLIVFLEREYRSMVGCVPFVKSELQRAGYYFFGTSETTMIWEADGVMCRCRADHLEENEGWIIDLKFTGNANPAELEREIIKMDYHVQAAAEIEALETLRPDLEGRVRFVDVFIEVGDDNRVEVVDIEHSESMLQLGRARWNRARKIWQECLASNEWPGYKKHTGKREPLLAHAPLWAINKEFGERA